MSVNANQRVTNAILQKDIDSLADKIENLADNVEEWRKEDRKAREKTTGRLKAVETHTITCATLWTEHKETHQTIDTDIKDVEGDVKKWSTMGGVGGGFFAIIASIFLDR